MTIIAAADGSALGNPGPAGWAWYVDPTHWASGGWPHGTNNMGELMAVLDLLQQTAHLDEPLHVICDSNYVINSITKWMAGWKRKGWKKGDGKPVMNVDLMKALDAAMQGRQVTFEWVKGHSGHPLNEEADALANAAAVAYKEGRTPEAGPGYPDATTDHPAAQVSQASQANQPVAEEDLFTALEEPEQPEQPEGDAVSEVLAYERALLSDEVRNDPVSLAAHLHADWSLVGDSGHVWSREDWLDRVAAVGPVEVEVLRAEQVDDHTVLLVWRGHDASGSAVHSTWWVRPGRRWVQRFHHVSRTSG
ncbi:ribonuclease HI family protein [Nocardioides daphniae]|uniref:Ribonuclease H n=1 Tax=Nocardioides daphniae TaxID=402297 RepID=A0A4P7U8L6_9ACTN|nr:ribonuclease HI family protein [Nocardioides daphniae]QCC76513.1 ribonuclease HI family protein [Nocardioides daphniae]